MDSQMEDGLSDGRWTVMAASFCSKLSTSYFNCNNKADTYLNSYSEH